MKYEEVNWLEWPGSPRKEIFDDWVKARKSKKHPVLTHTAMSKYSRHVFRAVSDGVCSIDEAFEYAAEGGWRAIMYQYLIGAKSKEIDMFSRHVPMQIEKATRDMTLSDEMDDAWARGSLN
jgi:hypothetical protein